MPALLSFKLDWIQADDLVLDSNQNDDNRSSSSSSSATLVEHYKVAPGAKGSDRLWNLVEAARKVGLTVQVLPPDYCHKRPFDDNPNTTHFNKCDETCKRMHEESCFLLEQCNTGERVFDCRDKDGQVVISFQRLAICDAHCIFYRATRHPKSLACVRAARKNRKGCCPPPPCIMELKHQSVPVVLQLQMGSNFTLTACSGRGKEPKDVKTVFLLKGSGGTVVAKALYEYNAIGPKLELLEVAIQLRRRGLGSSMLRAIEDYYRTRAVEDYYRTLFGLKKPILFLQAAPKKHASSSSRFQHQHDHHDPTLFLTDICCRRPDSPRVHCPARTTIHGESLAS